MPASSPLCRRSRCCGLVSDATGSLFTGICSVYLVAPLIAACMIRAIITLPQTEDDLLLRAAEAGEAV